MALAPAVLILAIAELFASTLVRPSLLDNYRSQPVGWIFPALVAAGLALAVYYSRRGDDRRAFLGSCTYIIAMLGGAAFALYPVLLPSSTGDANNLTIFNAASGPNSLSVGLIWWTGGMLIAIGYFVLIYRLFAGKVRDESYPH